MQSVWFAELQSPQDSSFAHPGRWHLFLRVCFQYAWVCCNLRIQGLGLRDGYNHWPHCWRGEVCNKCLLLQPAWGPPWHYGGIWLCRGLHLMSGCTDQKPTFSHLITRKPHSHICCDPLNPSLSRFTIGSAHNLRWVCAGGLNSTPIFLYPYWCLPQWSDQERGMKCRWVQGLSDILQSPPRGFEAFKSLLFNFPSFLILDPGLLDFHMNQGICNSHCCHRLDYKNSNARVTVQCTNFRPSFAATDSYGQNVTM
jgi:hypothetical protein